MADEIKKKKSKGLGTDIFEQAIHEVMPPIANRVVAAMPESWFKEDDAIIRLVEKALPLLSIAIAQITPDSELTDDLRTELTAEIRRALKERREGTTPTHTATTNDGTAKENPMDPQVVVWSEDLGGGAKKHTYHHSDCIDLPPRVEEKEVPNKGPKGGTHKVSVPNKSLRFMKESVAKGQGVASHADCCAILEEAKEKAKEKATPPSKKKNWAEVAANLQPAELTDFWTWIGTIIPAPLRHEILARIQQRLTSVDQFKAIMATPVDERADAVENILPDSDAEKMMDKLACAGLAVVADARTAGANMASDLETLGKNQAAKAKLVMTERNTKKTELASKNWLRRLWG